MPHDLAVVILAAGGSTRLGQPKQLVMHAGKTLLARAVEEALAAKLGPVVVVLGARATEMRTVLADYAVEAVENPQWETGLGSSIVAGVAAIAPRTVAGVLLMLCDQPGLGAEHLATLGAVWRTHGGHIACSLYGEVRGVPAVFGRAIFPELLALGGTRGAQAVIGRDADRVCTLEFPAGLWDIDTPEDLARLIGPEGLSQ
jgi:molybdenum cofactor cytidylyltransferase